MPSASSGTETVVLAMTPGRNRALLAEWLDTWPGYTVTTTDAEGTLPASYDICLLDVACFRAFRAELTARIEDADGVYLPHMLLLRTSETPRKPRDRLPDFGTIADAIVDEMVTLPVEKAVLHRRIENLLTTRRTSLRLAEREEQYQQLVELTPESIIIASGDEVLYANSAANSLLGDRDADLVGQSLRSLVADESVPSFERLLGAMAESETGTATEFTEFTFQRFDGSSVEVSLAAVPVTFEGKRVVQLLVRDLSEENRRKEQIQLFGRAVESVAVGVTIVDAQQEDQPVVYANKGFQRLTGYSLGEVLGRNCRFLQGPKTNQSTRSTVREALEEGEPVSVDILNYRKNETTFWNRLDITPVFGEGGELTHFLGFQQDITERVRRKQRLAVLNRILRHNVRNKTNVISGYAEAIQRGDVDPTAASNRILDAADELHTISEQIREFDTVMQEGGTDSVLLDLEATVQDGVSTVRERCPDATVELNIAADGEPAVWAHQTLRAALANFFGLLADAPSPNCFVELERVGDDVSLVVVDRSGTLAPEELELVETGTESSLEHLQRLELWLLRWAVDQSGGSFETETLGTHPAVRLRFDAAD